MQLQFQLQLQLQLLSYRPPASRSALFCFFLVFSPSAPHRFCAAFSATYFLSIIARQHVCRIVWPHHRLFCWFSPGNFNRLPDQIASSRVALGDRCSLPCAAVVATRSSFVFVCVCGARVVPCVCSRITLTRRSVDRSRLRLRRCVRWSSNRLPTHHPPPPTPLSVSLSLVSQKQTTFWSSYRPTMAV